ncbi:MAG: hypothetical protein ACJARL_002070 [Halopseudomonas sp.]|jgi:hypothetical protein
MIVAPHLVKEVSADQTGLGLFALGNTCCTHSLLSRIAMQNNA